MPITRSYDLIVLGGGIHGLMIALQAAEDGQRVLLLEKGRLGHQTSGAWFGILHGGLRYLQNLDVPRLRQSVTARRWFLAEMPDLVQPQPFLMPLYGRGLKRPEVFRLAFLAERVLSADRNRGVPRALALPPGRVLSRTETIARYPDVRTEGLAGAAEWHEAVVPDGPALIAAIADRARAAGAEIHEGIEATGLLMAGRRAAGVTATGQDGTHEWQAPLVINAAGPWSGVLARALDPAAPALFHPALGFNLLLDRPAPAPFGLSLVPPGQAGPMLFLYPQMTGPHVGRCFAGTWYAPWTGQLDAPAPDKTTIAAFLSALNTAVPGLAATPDHILNVSAGLLPARAPDTVDLANRDVIHDHGRHGGPSGLLSLVGVKYTTAGRLTRQVLKRAQRF